MAATSYPRKLTSEHIEWLADRHDVEVNWIADLYEASSYPTRRQVWVPHPSNVMRYLACLHEFGHVVHPQARKLWKSDVTKMPELMACEGYAWGWAIDHVLPEVRPLIDARVWHKLGQMLFSHLLYQHLPD